MVAVRSHHHVEKRKEKNESRLASLMKAKRHSLSRVRYFERGR